MTIQNGINANTVTPLPITGGGTGVNALPTTVVASQFAAWNASANLPANNVLLGYATTVTAAGTTTLTVASAYQQFFTGTTSQTVVMPVTSTLVLGQSYRIINNSTAAITVNASGGGLIVSMSPNTESIVTCILTSGTTAASWTISYTQSAYFNYVNPVDYASAAANLNAAYNNGASGIGATLTNAGTLAAFSVDGASPTLGQRILVAAQSTPAQNGIYVLTTVGDGATPWVLTRATDFDSPEEIQAGDFVTVQSGTQYGSSAWLQTATVATVGTSPIVFSLFGVPINNVVTLDTNQTITGQKTFNATTAVTGTLNVTGQLNADNLRLDGDTLSTTDTNGNLILNPNGTGAVQVNSANTILPLQIYSGTALQHITNFIMPNTASTRNVTFPDSSGTLAYLSNVGFQFIASALPSNVSSVVFNNLTGFTNYYVYFFNIVPITNSVLFSVQASINNGSTWLTTSGNYLEQAVTVIGSTAAGAAFTTSPAIFISNTLSNTATTTGFGGEMLLINPAATTNSKMIQSFGFGIGASGATYQTASYVVTASAINAIQFLMSGGNIASGQIFLYGIL